MSKAATRPALELLHDALATELAAAVKEKELKVIEIPDEASEGGTKRVAVQTRNAAVLNAARQFLKDNGIECAPGHPSPAVKNLASELPPAGAPLAGDDDDDPALRPVRH